MQLNVENFDHSIIIGLFLDYNSFGLSISYAKSTTSEKEKLVEDE